MNDCERCGTCKVRKANKTCKWCGAKHITGDYDWCAGYKKRK